MTAEEIRMRCLEAATKFPNADIEGQAAGVVKAAAVYEKYVVDGEVPGVQNLL